jgi:large subunit ribosomal protein L30e
MSREVLDNILKFVVRTGKIVIGFNQTLKHVKWGKVKYIIISSNAPESLRSDIEHYAKLSGIPIISYPGTNRELGTVLGKPFSVAFAGIIDLGQVSEDSLKPFVKM